MTSTIPESLNARLDATKQQLSEIAPPELFGVFSAEQQRLAAEEDRSGYVAVGDVVAAFTLPDAHGHDVTLDELLTGGPVVLVFYRGAWCPYCNVALKAYQAELVPALTELGVTLAAISPQGPDGSLTVEQSNALTFPVLTDAGSALARELGLVFELTDDVKAAQLAFGNDFTAINASGEWALPKPAVLVVDAARTVRFVDVQADYTLRTEPGAVLDAVRAVVGLE